MAYHTIRNISTGSLDLVMYNESNGDYYNIRLRVGEAILETSVAISFMPQMDWLLRNKLVNINPSLTAEDARAVSYWLFGIRGRVNLFSELPDPADEFLNEIYIVNIDEGSNLAGWYRVEDSGGSNVWEYFYNPGAASVLIDNDTIQQNIFGQLYVANFPALGSVDGGNFD